MFFETFVDAIEFLFEYAKNELTNLASSGQPFNFNMLTADTHHIGGYPCSVVYCKFTVFFQRSPA